MEFIGKLASNDTSNIGMLPSDSKDVSIKFAVNVYTLSITNKY